MEQRAHEFSAPHARHCFVVSIAALCIFFCVTTAFAAPTSLPATTQSSVTTQNPIARQNLLSHANSDFCWLARVAPGTDPLQPGEQTQIDFRAFGQENWQHLTTEPMPDRALCLASLSGQLAVLLDGREWVLVGEEGGGSSGQPLPGWAKMLALAGDSETLWAIGLTLAAPESQPAPTQPATTESAATMPATTQSAVTEAHLMLFTLKPGGLARWNPVGHPLPPEIEARAPLSLAIIERTPWLAVEKSDHQISVYRQTADGWQSIATVDGPPLPGAFKLLDNLSPATLWVAGPTVDELKLLAPGGPTKSVKLLETNAPINDRTALYAANALREIAIVDGKIVEQEYNPQTFTPQRKSSTAKLPVSETPTIVTPLFRIALFAAVALAIFASARRRGEMTDPGAGLENLTLADTSRRLAAGLIDGIPFVFPIVLVIQSILSSDRSSLGTETMIGFLAAVFIYVVHTAASETLTTRTIGKYLLGLRVVKADGTTPDASSLLIRNFLRVVDVGLMGVPLVFILYSPLRQRIGDVAGGTVVIRDRVKPEGILIDPPAAEIEAVVTPVATDPEPPAPA